MTDRSEEIKVQRAKEKEIEKFQKTGKLPSGEFARKAVLEHLNKQFVKKQKVQAAKDAKFRKTKAFRDAQRIAVDKFKKTGVMPTSEIGKAAVREHIVEQAKRRQRISELKRSGGFVNVTLSKTASDILSGKSDVPLKQVGSNVERQVRLVQAQERFISGKTTREQFRAEKASIEKAFGAKQKLEKERRASTSAKQARSTALKQSEARAIASAKGIAIGTISNQGDATLASNSLLASGQNIQQFVVDQRPKPTQNLQLTSPQQQIQKQGERFAVTTADGKVRIFKSKENAEKFVQRITPKEQFGPPAPFFGVTTIDGKQRLFKSQAHAQEFLRRTTKNEALGTTEGLSGNPLIRGTEGILTSLDRFVRDRPTDPTLSHAKTIIDHPASALKSLLAGGASLANLAHQGISFLQGKEVKQPLVRVPDTFFGTVIGGVFSDKSAKAQTDDLISHSKEVGGGAVVGEVSETVLGSFVGGSKIITKLSPFGIKSFDQPGVTVFSKTITKVPKNTPRAIPKEIGIKSLTVGFREREIPILSKVGPKVRLGGPEKLIESEVGKVTVVPKTPTQVQRGTKFAADSPQFTQKVGARLIPKIEGLDPASKVKAVAIEDIVKEAPKIKTEPISNELPKQAFNIISSTEQKNILSAIGGLQTKLFNRIGPLEGSVSQSFFTLPKHRRVLGDFDFHGKDFGKASKQIKFLQDNITLDSGRKLVNTLKQTVKRKDPKTGETTNVLAKSAKLKVIDEKGKSEKLLEIVTKDEIDEQGVGQVLSGSTIFGKPVPSETFKVAGGLKTFGLQRQIVKKGESIFSIQPIDNTLSALRQEPQTAKITKEIARLEELKTKGITSELAPAHFRFSKDTGDFIAATESTIAIARSQGKFKEAAKLESALAKVKQTTPHFDSDKFFASRRQLPDDLSFGFEKSTLEKLGTSVSQVVTNPSVLPTTGSLAKIGSSIFDDSGKPSKGFKPSSIFTKTDKSLLDDVTKQKTSISNSLSKRPELPKFETPSSLTSQIG